MADITVQIALDTKGVVLGEQQFRRSTENIRRSAKQTKQSVDKNSEAFFALQKAVRLVDGPLGGVAARFETLNSVSKGAERSMLGVVAAVAAAGAALTTLVRAGDQLQQLQNRLRLVTNGIDELNLAQAQLFKISQETRTSLQANVTLFSRLARNAGQYNISQKQVLSVTELVAKATATLGGNAQSTEAALFQLSQGLAANRLSGQELNSILEQATPIATNLEKGLKKLGFEFDSLKEFAEDGGVTFERFIKALEAMKSEIDRDFSTAVVTLGGAFQKLGNAITVYVGGISQATGASSKLASAISGLADSFGVILQTAVTVVGGLFLRTLIPTIAALTTSVVLSSGAVKAFALSVALLGPAGVVGAAIPAVVGLAGALRTLLLALGPFGLAFAAAGFAADKMFSSFTDGVSTQLKLQQSTAELQTKYGSLTSSVNGVTEATRLSIQEDVRKAASISLVEEATRKANRELAFERTLREQGSPILPFVQGGAADAVAKAAEETVKYETRLKKIIDDLGYDPFSGRRTSAQPKGTPISEDLAENLNKSLKKVKETVTPVERIFERAADNINDAFTDTFRDIFRDGISGFKGFVDRIKDLFIDLLAQMATLAIAKPVIVPIVQGVGGLLGVGRGGLDKITGQLGGGGSGGVSGITSLFSSGQTAGGFSRLNQFGANNLGTGLPGLSGGLTSASLTSILGAGGIGFFGGGLLADLTGGNTTGGSIGGGLGAAAGMATFGPIGAAVGGTLGAAIGSLFGGGAPSQISQLYAETGSNGLTETRTAGKTIGTEFADGLAQGLGTITQSLNAVQGLGVSGLSIFGGRNNDRGFFDIGRVGSPDILSSIEFDPTDEKQVNEGLARLTLELAKLGNVTGKNLTTALENINTEGRTFEEVLGDLQFASLLDNLTFVNPVISSMGAAISELNAQANEYIEKAKGLRLEEEKIAQARDLQFNRLRGGFNQNISNRILSISNPTAFQLQGLQSEIAPILREAVDIGGNLALVEEFYGLRRKEILEDILGEQETAIEGLRDRLKDYLLDIQAIRDSLLLNPQLGGLNRLGRANEAQNIFDRLSNRIASGDISALDDLQSTTQDYLNASLDYFGPTEQYLSRLEDVFQLLNKADDLARSSVSVEEQMLREQFTTNDLLQQLIESTGQAFANTGLGTPVSLAQILRPGEDDSVLDKISAISGLSLRTDRSLKVQSSFGAFNFANAEGTFADFVKMNPQAGLNYLENLGDFLADQADVGSILDSQRALFGFASGTGNSRYGGGLAMVGERGPELVNFGSPAQIVTSGNTEFLYGAEQMAKEFAAYRQQSAKETEYLGSQLERLGQRVDELSRSMSNVALRSTPV